MTFQALPRTAIPKREAPVKTVNLEEANAILAILQGDAIDGAAPTATDGESYADEKSARAAANKAKRLVGHVLPDGQIVKTQTFGLVADADGVFTPVLAKNQTAGFGFTLWLEAAPVEAPAVETAAPKGKGK